MSFPVELVVEGNVEATQMALNKWLIKEIVREDGPLMEEEIFEKVAEALSYSLATILVQADDDR